MRFTVNLHRRRAQPTRAALDPAVTFGFRACYKAKAGACHPSVVFFELFWLGGVPAAQRSGRRIRVRASASARRHAATLAWSPETRMSGIGRPSNTWGRVYWGYSSREAEKLSSSPDSALPMTPGSSLTQA